MVLSKQYDASSITLKRAFKTKLWTGTGAQW